MKDPFSYSARWSSVGLDCSTCLHVQNVNWPLINKNYNCLLHNVSLSKTIGENGFKEGEWFCKSFSSNGNTNGAALSEFQLVQNQLNENTLYGAYGDKGNLKEIAFVEL